MSSYQIAIPYDKFIAFLENTKPDATSKNSKNLVGTDWMAPILREIHLAENYDDIQIQVDKSRLYEFSKKSTNFLTVHAHCKFCPSKYLITLRTKPEKDCVFNFKIEKTLDHDKNQHENRKVQVKGQQREMLAKSVLLKTSGSAKNYYDSQVGQNLTNVPSQEVMRKCVSEFLNKDMVSTNWIINILYQQELCKILLKGKYLNGYVHDLEIADQFSMTLAFESQYEALHKLPFQRRIIHMNATGRLIKIPKYMREYGKILTYAFIVQDLDKLSNETKDTNNNYLLLSETSTSKHDTEQLSKMFLKLNTCYKSLYPNDNLCYMLVLDLSWIYVHAAVTILNNESFTDYNNRVFRMANGEMEAFDKSKVLIASCANHTIHIFTKCLNKKNLFSTKSQFQHQEFAIFCFSLLLNCSDLKTISDIFMLICVCFCSSTTDSDKARETLQKLIQLRPTMLDDIEPPKDNENAESVEEDEEKEQLTDELHEKDDDDVESFLKMNNILSKRRMIKNQSLFNQHFIDIAEKVKSENFDREIDNLSYNPKYVEFLLEYFMPYCGIWSGFVFQEIKSKKNEEFTRITNGIIEKFWHIRKNQFRQVQPPANYVTNTLNSTKGQLAFFVENLNKDEISSFDSDNEREDEYLTDTEKNIYSWEKNPQSKTIRKRKANTNAGFFLRPQNTQKKFKAAIPTEPKAEIDNLNVEPMEYQKDKNMK